MFYQTTGRLTKDAVLIIEGDLAFLCFEIEEMGFDISAPENTELPRRKIAVRYETDEDDLSYMTQGRMIAIEGYMGVRQYIIDSSENDGWVSDFFMSASHIYISVFTRS